MDIYDIFGLASQTLQGADLLAHRLNIVVLIPDFFDGGALAHDIIPPDTEEKQKTMHEFLATKANIPRNVEVLVEAMKQYQTRFPTVSKWGAFGLCWGGKVSQMFLHGVCNNMQESNFLLRWLLSPLALIPRSLHQAKFTLG